MPLNPISLDAVIVTAIVLEAPGPHILFATTLTFPAVTPVVTVMDVPVPPVVIDQSHGNVHV